MTATVLPISAEELASLREMVIDGYHIALQDAGIEQYGNHAAIFPKSARLFPVEYVDSVKIMPFVQALREQFGHFDFSDVVLDGRIEKREEVYWRIVRPNEPTDVGPMHCDREFHERDGMHAGKETIKCWIPLFCEPLCGLLIGEEIHSTPGTLVAFGADVQHQGMVNHGKTARVSMEITLVLRGN